MVMELEKPIRPLEQQLLKERNRIPRNQQNSTTAEVHMSRQVCIQVHQVSRCVDQSIRIRARGRDIWFGVL